MHHTHERTCRARRLLSASLLGSVLVLAGGCLSETDASDLASEDQQASGLSRPSAEGSDELTEDQEDVAFEEERARKRRTKDAGAGKPIGADSGRWDSGPTRGEPGSPGAPGDAVPPPVGCAPDPKPGWDAGKPAPVTPPARVCKERAFGAKGCVPLDSAKLVAHELCVADGLELYDLKLSANCNGGAVEGVAVCCVPQPPPKPVLSDCYSDYLGDGASCIDATNIKLKASGVCESTRSTLTDVYAEGSESCKDGGATRVKFSCCRVSAVPDEDPKSYL